jgi:hypothetical protein
LSLILYLQNLQTIETQMTWKCPNCGHDPIEDSIAICSVCGYRKFPGGVILRSEATGKQIEIRLTGTFGSRSLTRLEDPGIKFVSSEQFRIEKRVEEGGWAVIPILYAKNPTYLNGEALQEAGQLISDGMRLSIKDKHFFLLLSLI